MSRYVSEYLANEVFSRGEGICEYCRISIDDTYFGGEIDHIRSINTAAKLRSTTLLFHASFVTAVEAAILALSPLGQRRLSAFSIQE